MKALIIDRFNQEEFEKLANLISNHNSWATEEPTMIYICGGACACFDYIDSFEHLILKNPNKICIYVDSHVSGSAKAFVARLYKHKARFVCFEAIQQKPLEIILF